MKFQQQGGKCLAAVGPERFDEVDRSHHVVFPRGKRMDVEGNQKLVAVLTLGHELAVGSEYPHPDILDFAAGIGRVCPRKGGGNAVIIIIAPVVGAARRK